jgi:hypothetical protein
MDRLRTGAMKVQDKKNALAAYKERKVVAGIYAVRCLATGQCWVGGAIDLGTIRNRLWFGLRMGGDPHPTLQAAWHAHGADSFAFEEVERFDDAAPGYVRELALRDRLAHWRAELGAGAI